MVYDYERLKGIIRSYVINNPAKKVQSKNTVLANIQTYLEKGKVNDSELGKILSDVEKDILEGLLNIDLIINIKESDLRT